MAERAWDRHGGQAPDRGRFLELVAMQIVLDAESRSERWRDASLAERGTVLAELLDFVDAVGRYPPKREMFPGFPGSRARHG